MAEVQATPATTAGKALADDQQMSPAGHSVSENLPGHSQQGLESELPNSVLRSVS